jgi:hypothetical protein
MTQNEEESLIKWILSMDQRGATPRPSRVQEMANILLAQRGSTAIETVGEKWVHNFINRHDEIKTESLGAIIISVLNSKTQSLSWNGLIVSRSP